MHTLACPHIPQPAVMVETAGRDQVPAVVEAHRHDLCAVACERQQLRALLNIPQLQYGRRQARARLSCTPPDHLASLRTDLLARAWLSWGLRAGPVHCSRRRIWRCCEQPRNSSQHTFAVWSMDPVAKMVELGLKVRHTISISWPAPSQQEQHEHMCGDCQPPARAWLPGCSSRRAQQQAWRQVGQPPGTCPHAQVATTQQLCECTLLTSQLLAALPAVHIPQPGCFVKTAGCHPIPVRCVEGDRVHLGHTCRQAVRDVSPPYGLCCESAQLLHMHRDAWPACNISVSAAAATPTTFLWPSSVCSSSPVCVSQTWPSPTHTAVDTSSVARRATGCAGSHPGWPACSSRLRAGSSAPCMSCHNCL